MICIRTWQRKSGDESQSGGGSQCQAVAASQAAVCRRHTLNQPPTHCPQTCCPRSLSACTKGCTSRTVGQVLEGISPPLPQSRGIAAGRAQRLRRHHWRVGSCRGRCVSSLADRRAEGTTPVHTPTPRDPNAWGACLAPAKHARSATGAPSQRAEPKCAPPTPGVPRAPQRDCELLPREHGQARSRVPGDG